MNENNEFEKEIEKKANQLFRDREITEISHPSDFIKILNEGARLQREFDAIAFIQESYCLDSYKEAKNFWDKLVNSRKKEKEKEEAREKLSVKELKEIDEFLKKEELSKLAKTKAIGKHCPFCNIASYLGGFKKQINTNLTHIVLLTKNPEKWVKVCEKHGIDINDTFSVEKI